MSKTIDDARQMIESRLAEIEAEVRQLERALPHMTGDGDRSSRRARSSREAIESSTTSAKSGRRKSSRRKAGGRAAKGERRAQLLAAIKANPGARPSELAKSIGIRPTQVSVLIAKARSEKLIVKSGKGYKTAS